MRLQQYITEIFDSKGIKVKKKEESMGTVIYMVEFDDFRYYVNFGIDPEDIGTEDEGTYNIVFDSMSNRGPHDDIMDIGTGNALKVFSGVIKALRMFIREYKPERISFSAKQKSRQKLYDRFVKMVEKESKFKLLKTYMKHGRKNYLFGT